MEVPGLTDASLQGDAAFCDVLSAMGCSAVRGEQSTIVEGGSLHGIDIDMVDMSDLVPTLAAVAVRQLAHPHPGVGFIRAKESVACDLCAELRRLPMPTTDDGFDPSRRGAATAVTHHDHRLAMAFVSWPTRSPASR